MSQKELEGESEKMKGKAREQIGKITDDPTQELKGKGEQFSGEMKKKVGEVERKT